VATKIKDKWTKRLINTISYHVTTF